MHRFYLLAYLKFPDCFEKFPVLLQNFPALIFRESGWKALEFFGLWA